MPLKMCMSDIQIRKMTCLPEATDITASFHILSLSSSYFAEFSAGAVEHKIIATVFLILYLMISLTKLFPSQLDVNTEEIKCTY